MRDAAPRPLHPLHPVHSIHSIRSIRSTRSIRYNDRKSIIAWKRNLSKKAILLYFILPLLLLFLIGSRNNLKGTASGKSKSSFDISRYGPRLNTTNKFITQFEESLLNDIGHDIFIPFIFENDKLLCQQKHQVQLSSYRSRFFTKMVRRGIAL